MSGSNRRHQQSTSTPNYCERMNDWTEQLREQFEIDISELLGDADRALNSNVAELKSASKTMKNLVQDGQREREMSQHLNERELGRLVEIRRLFEETLVSAIEKLHRKEEQTRKEDELEEPLADPSLPNRECVVCGDSINEALMFCCTGGNNPERHYICRECCKGYAAAKVGDGVLSQGGIGLPCAGGCDGFLLWGPISKIVDPAVARNVEARLAGMALDGMDDIEYCKSCHYGVLITRKEQQYFACQNPFCLVKFCRTCQIDYEKHLNKTCDVADPTRKDSKRALEEFLSAAKYRVCHRCKTHFTKDNDTSCNKMTCSCGATQCYICKASDVTYDHFGTGDKCPLFNDTAEADRINLEHAIQEAGKKDEWRKFLPELLTMREGAQ